MVVIHLKELIEIFLGDLMCYGLTVNLCRHDEFVTLLRYRDITDSDLSTVLALSVPALATTSNILQGITVRDTRIDNLSFVVTLLKMNAIEMHVHKLKTSAVITIADLLELLCRKFFCEGFAINVRTEEILALVLIGYYISKYDITAMSGILLPMIAFLFGDERDDMTISMNRRDNLFTF